MNKFAKRAVCPAMTQLSEKLATVLNDWSPGMVADIVDLLEEQNRDREERLERANQALKKSIMRLWYSVIGRVLWPDGLGPKPTAKPGTLEWYMDLPYLIEIQPQEDAAGFEARCPELGRWSIVGSGETLEEAIENLQRCKHERLSRYLQLGYNVPLPKNYEGERGNGGGQ